MQFGIFTVGDVTTDPTTGRTPTEAERIKAMVAIAEKAEEVGLDVFATGEHHNPPFVPSSPTTMLGYIAARTERLLLSTSTTLITTNDPVKIAEDYAMLQHLADGRVDLMMGRGNTGPVYPVVRQGHPRRHRPRRRELRAAAPALGRGRRRLGGSVPHAAPGLHLDAPPARRRGAVRVARLDPQPRRSPSRPPSTATASSPTTSSGPRSTSSGWSASTGSGSSTTATARPTRPSSASAARCSWPATARTRCGSSARTSTTRPVYGGGPSLEEFMAETPLTVGSPQEVIDRTLTFREHFGDYQRQLFLMDHAGLPLPVVLDQLELLGGEVVPVLRRELDAMRPAHVPDGPTHAGRSSPRPPPRGRRARRSCEVEASLTDGQWQHASDEAGSAARTTAAAAPRTSWRSRRPGWRGPGREVAAGGASLDGGGERAAETGEGVAGTGVDAAR